MVSGRNIVLFASVLIVLFFVVSPVIAEEEVKIGLNYPVTGPYSAQGVDQKNATDLALEEINATGGILGKKVIVLERDSKSMAPVARDNVAELIDKEGVKMIFGGVSSGVAVATGEICQEKKTIFMATITASNATTGEKGHRHTFRVCSNAWMGAKALSGYLNANYKDKNYLYIVSDYTWGWSCEKSLRKHTNTENKKIHKRVLVPLGAKDQEFMKAIRLAKMEKPDVLVMVLFGDDMTKTIRFATMEGLKEITEIVVPIIEINMAEGVGPGIMEDVVAVTDWNWAVPEKYNYVKGKNFVKAYSDKYGRYPGWCAAMAYTNLMQYKAAVEKAGSFDSERVIIALEGSSFICLKDQQDWRDFDHQCVQTMYIVKCKKKSDVENDKYKLDYFEIIDEVSGDKLVQTRKQWNRRRELAKQSPYLEWLPTEIASDTSNVKKE